MMEVFPTLESPSTTTFKKCRYFPDIYFSASLTFSLISYYFYQLARPLLSSLAAKRVKLIPHPGIEPGSHG